MPNPNNMSQLFEKLNDLKTLFSWGQKLVPIIQSLVDFMQETVPLLENINTSIADSTLKIPKAATQISSVTNATELATTEILDLVDVIANNLSSIEETLNKELKLLAEKQAIYTEMEEMLKGNARGVELLEALKQKDTVSETISKVLEVFPLLKNDTYNITLSLQVQDITSQQLAAVTHLIESVQNKLTSLIHDIDQNELEKLNFEYKAPEGATFDPDAAYDKSESRQDMVDAIINKENHKASQDEIDKLFS